MKPAEIILFVIMIALIILMDVLFFRHKFIQRLIANILTVAVFIAIYFIFLKH